MAPRLAGEVLTSAALCPNAPISGDYIKAEGQRGRMGSRLMAVIAEGPRGTVYLPPTTEMESYCQEQSRNG